MNMDSRPSVQKPIILIGPASEEDVRKAIQKKKSVQEPLKFKDNVKASSRIFNKAFNTTLIIP